MIKHTLKRIALALTFAATTAAFAQEGGGGVLALNPSPSADGKQVVFSADFSSPDSQLHLWVANMDGGHLHRLTTNPNAQIDEESAWSPTANVIAFSSYDGTNSNIWSITPQGSRLVQLTSGSLNNHSPTWSSNGQKIAFVSDRSGTNDIWIMNADGSGQKRLTTLLGEENNPSFSPDGSAIVFSETANDHSNLWIVNVDGTGLRQLTDNQFEDSRPSWGSNGIIFSTNRDTSTVNWKVWVVQPDGTGLRKFGDFLATDPVWTHDGKVLFTDETTATGAQSVVSIFNPSTGTKRIVVDRSGYDAHISIRPFREPHIINLESHGRLRVAILSSRTFNAVDQVDKDSIRFGHSGHENSLYKCYSKGKDVNGDGIPDLICRFYISRTGLGITDTKAKIRFSDLNRTIYEGTDSIKVIPKEDFLDKIEGLFDKDDDNDSN